MYVYLIKCCNYYKIGFSKNPKNRRKTVQTHNPLDVVLCAQLKTEKYNEIEKHLHDIFSEVRTRGEWFELKDNHLNHLKIEYGFHFFIPIRKIDESENYDNSEGQSQTKKFRIDNSNVTAAKEYFENVFSCNVVIPKQIKKSCMKFDLDVVQDSINNLFDQDYDANEALDSLYRFSKNGQLKKDDPSKYVTKIASAIFYKHYNYSMDDEERSILEKSDFGEDIDGLIKKMNSQKYYLDYQDFWGFLVEQKVFI